MLLMKHAKRLLLFGLFSITSIAQPLFVTEPDVRVRIINTMDTLNMVLTGGWTLGYGDSLNVTFSDASIIQIIHSKDQIKVLDSTGILVPGVTTFRLIGLCDTSYARIQAVPYGVGWWWAGAEDRIYEGGFHIYIDSDQNMSVTLKLALETYLKGVVPYEIGPTSPLEALKAQAVAARSEAVIALSSGLYCGEHHDLTSDVECQVFSGNARRSVTSDQAVDETRGLVLREKGQVMNAYYASNCGGRSALIENVWPDRPRLESYKTSLPDNRSRRCPKLFCNWRAKRWIKASPVAFCNPELEPALPEWSRENFRWTREFELDELSTMLAGNQNLGLFKSMKVLERGLSGRIYKALFIFEQGSITVDGELALRQRFRPSLRSATFYIKKRGSRVTLYGAGWGHGVGMCQSGAIALASHGTGFGQILTHYYTKATLLDIYGGELTKSELTF